MSRFGDKLRMVHLNGLAILPRRPGELRQEIRIAVLVIGGRFASYGHLASAGQNADLRDGQSVVRPISLRRSRSCRRRRYLHGAQPSCRHAYISGPLRAQHTA